MEGVAGKRSMLKLSSRPKLLFSWEKSRWSVSGKSWAKKPGTLVILRRVAEAIAARTTRWLRLRMCVFSRPSAESRRRALQMRGYSSYARWMSAVACSWFCLPLVRRPHFPLISSASSCTLQVLHMDQCTLGAEMNMVRCHKQFADEPWRMNAAWKSDSFESLGYIVLDMCRI